MDSLQDILPEEQNLVHAAFEASRSAYAPYSRFAVDAAVLTTKGTIYTGANMENASYGLGICAEVAALCSANTAGDFTPTKIAVVGYPIVEEKPDKLPIVRPCGRCRQIISEASKLNNKCISVISCSGDLNDIEISSIEELLPNAFELNSEQSWFDLQGILLKKPIPAAERPAPKFGKLKTA